MGGWVREPLGKFWGNPAGGLPPRVFKTLSKNPLGKQSHGKFRSSDIDRKNNQLLREATLVWFGISKANDLDVNND